MKGSEVRPPTAAPVADHWQPTPSKPGPARDLGADPRPAAIGRGEALSSSSSHLPRSRLAMMLSSHWAGCYHYDPHHDGHPRAHRLSR